MNDDLFPVPEILLKQVRALKIEAEHRTDLTPNKAFEIFAGGDEKRGQEIDARCKRLPPIDIHDVLFPSFEVRGSFKDADAYAMEMQRKFACKLEVKHMPKIAVLGFPDMTIALSGHDQSIIFVFDHRGGDHLNEPVSDTVRLFLSGLAKINEKEQIYYWEIILTTIEGFVVQSGKGAGGAIF